MKYKNIGVMCGSSEVCPQKYLDLAYSLGEVLGKNKRNIIYGGGAKGLMKRVADGALDQGAEVYGYMPEFMTKVEWQHNKLTSLIITKDMDERKELMMRNSDATIFLPGGSGTMEEFFQWFVTKRLGKYLGPLILVNYEGFYDPLLVLLENMKRDKFHNVIHDNIYTVVSDISTICEAMENSPEWSPNAIEYAAAKN